MSNRVLRHWEKIARIRLSLISESPLYRYVHFALGAWSITFAVLVVREMTRIGIHGEAPVPLLLGGVLLVILDVWERILMARYRYRLKKAQP